MVGNLSADELDNLLALSNSDVKLVDDSATEAWAGVVEAFRRNDLPKARELGTAFLAANHKTSPYQLLGVQVMLDLANADNPTVTRDVGLTTEMKRLMSERDALRAKYANLQRVAQDADARINKLTNNRTQAVQAGTAAYRECARADQQIQQANAEMEAMRSEVEANKVKVGNVEVGANQNLKNDTMKLLDMLTEAGEIEAAFAIANVFIRVSGSDLDIAKKQQDVIRLRELQTKAGSIAKLIEGKQKAFIDQKRYWEALSVGEQSLSKVRQAGDKDLARLVTAKLSIDPLSIKRTIAKATSESSALRELARVDALKAKSMLKDFRGKYPDFPEMETLSIAVEGERSGEMKEKVAGLLRSVEDLADNDPMQAREILAGLSPDDIDPIDRRALETRITNAERKLYLAAEAARSADTKEKIAELLNSVEDFADTDPQRARETLDGLKLEDIDPVKRKALEIRITNAERKLYLAAEATRSADTKVKIAELLNSVENFADTDPQRARETLDGLKLEDIDPVKRRALEIRITNAERKLYLAAEATRSADTKVKIAELLNSVEDFADTDPQRARETLDGLKLEDIDPVKRRALEIRITNAERKLYLAAEATRSADTKVKIAELLNSVEELAETDPKQARRILGNLKSQDIDPVKRVAMETRISTAERMVISSSIREMESILSEVKSKLGGEVLQILANGKVKTDSSLGLSRQTEVAADIKMKIDQSAELPEVRASLTRLAATIASATVLHPSASQMAQINGIKAEVEVLRMAVR